jgi:hypothetical protein
MIRDDRVNLLFDPDAQQLFLFRLNQGPHPWSLLDLLKPLVLTSENGAWLGSCEWSSKLDELRNTIYRYSHKDAIGYGEMAVAESGELIAAASRFGTQEFKRVARFEGFPGCLSGQSVGRGLYVGIEATQINSYHFAISKVARQSIRDPAIPVPSSTKLFDYRGATKYYSPSDYPKDWPQEVVSRVRVGGEPGLVGIGLAEARTAVPTKGGAGWLLPAVGMAAVGVLGLLIARRTRLLKQPWQGG